MMRLSFLTIRGRQSTLVQPTSSIHTLSLSGADNPSSRSPPRRFCLSTRSRVVSLSCCDGTAYDGLEAAPAIFETAVHVRRVP
jgi:hypothetical protein